MSIADMPIECVRGAPACALLDQAQFLADWSALYAACPWATAFQGSGFIGAWYRIYREKFEPLLIISRAANGDLQGLLALAVSRPTGAMVVAGSHHAEYHAWISRPEHGNLFPRSAFRAVRRSIHRAGLKFRYLPPHAPTAWLLQSGMKNISILKAHPRPLLPFGNGAEIRKSLAKSGNKSRMRRLQKLGPVVFKRITDPEEFATHFDEIIRCYDTRRLAVNGSAPFLNDPLKKAFHLEMLRTPGLLHVTVLKVGEHIASAQLNTCGHKEIHLSLLAHHPFFAKHSPGKLHILHLGKMLMDEGYERMDLTAGGDAYKERFADAWDEVHTLSLFPSTFARETAGLHIGLEVAARKVLKHHGLTPMQAVSFAGKISRVNPARWTGLAMRRGRDWLMPHREIRIYRFSLSEINEISTPDDFHRDSLDDLLAYHPAAALPSRHEFMSDALRRIEEDQHVYTRVESGRLLHYGWLAERPTDGLVNSVFKDFPLPANSALILDLLTLPTARRRGWAERSLRIMLRDARAIPQTENVFIAIPTDSHACRLVEKIGFKHEGSHACH